MRSRCVAMCLACKCIVYLTARVSMQNGSYWRVHVFCGPKRVRQSWTLFPFMQCLPQSFQSPGCDAVARLLRLNGAIREVPDVPDYERGAPGRASVPLPRAARAVHRAHPCHVPVGPGPRRGRVRRYTNTNTKYTILVTQVEPATSCQCSGCI